MPFTRPILILLLVLSLPFASYAATPDEAASAVISHYRLTKPGFFGNFSEIGNVLTPRREGIRASRPSKVFKASVVKDDKVLVAGGGGLSLGGVHNGILKPGERLHLYDVRTTDDYVQLDLYTVATYVLPGIKGPTPLQASVRFHYDNGLAGVTVRKLLDDVGGWLDMEGEGRQNFPTTPAAAKRPADSPTSTIRFGQTQEEVAAIFGPPEKEILLGTKTIFIYPGVKVIFVDGKVADAE